MSQQITPEFICDEIEKLNRTFAEFISKMKNDHKVDLVVTYGVIAYWQ